MDDSLPNGTHIYSNGFASPVPVLGQSVGSFVASIGHEALEPGGSRRGHELDICWIAHE